MIDITEDVIDEQCDDARMAMCDLLENGPNEDDYDRASERLLNLRGILDYLMQPKTSKQS